MKRYIKLFATVVVITHLFLLTLLVMLIYFSDLTGAINNMSGWHTVQDNGVVHFHRFNLLHYMAITYFPAMIISPIILLIDWAFTPRNRFNTATGKPLLDIKL
tara:strand:+ start:639 stop:947 length:309 start_codon:yes stop_codon:yes gene_type:complete